MRFLASLPLLTLLAGGHLFATILPTFTITPSPIIVSANNTYGFDFVLTNNDGTNWLAVSGVQPLTDVPDLIIWDAAFSTSLPILAPNSSITIPWVLDTDGLAQFSVPASLDANLLPYTGSITIEFDFFDNDPAGLGASLVGSDVATAQFDVATPEPASFALLALGGASLVLLRRRSR